MKQFFEILTKVSKSYMYAPFRYASTCGFPSYATMHDHNKYYLFDIKEHRSLSHSCQTLCSCKSPLVCVSVTLYEIFICLLVCLFVNCTMFSKGLYGNK